MKKKFIAVAFIMAVTALALTSCKVTDNIKNKLNNNSYLENTRDVFAMDTYMTLKAYGENSDKALDAAVEEIERLDEMFSVGNEDSEVSMLNKSGSGKLSDESAYLIKTSLNLYETTNGSFDIAIFPLAEEWGFTTGIYKVPDDNTLNKLMKNIDASKIEFDEESNFVSLPEGMKIDFGGIAKGYTSQRVMEIFKEYDVSCGMVSLGGNVQTYNTKTDGSNWSIAIENPKDSTDYVGVVKLHDKAVITSGGYERYFEQDGITYHHILDPATGYPANSGLSSVTIVSGNGTLADGLSTSLFIMGKDSAISFWKQYGDEYDFDVILVTDDGKIYISQGLKNSFTSNYDFEIIEK